MIHTFRREGPKMSDTTILDTFLALKNIMEVNNALELAIDKALRKDDLTAKQFKMIATIGKAFDHAPSIKDVAEVLRTSHQNVKQMAEQLEKSGYLEIEKDQADRRMLRLKLTEKNTRYWMQNETEHARIMQTLFNDLEPEELRELNRLLGIVSGSVAEFIRS
jgi:DNA-binding MarR family transcriptional regulator